MLLLLLQPPRPRPFALLAQAEGSAGQNPWAEPLWCCSLSSPSQEPKPGSGPSPLDPELPPFARSVCERVCMCDRP